MIRGIINVETDSERRFSNAPYVTVGKENSGGIELYYKDWGSGQPVVFSHGWPLSADAWEDQMVFLAARGYRCIGHDRRGHGRSSQPWNGNDIDTYADDLAMLVERSISRTRFMSATRRAAVKSPAISAATARTMWPRPR